MNGINNFNNSLRISTRTSQPKTSSNSSFQDQFRGGLRAGVDVANNAVRQVLRPIPGAGALSASLSDVASKLGSGGLSSDYSGGPNANPVLDGDRDTLQAEMVKNNQDMLEKQWQVSQIANDFSTRSYILKALFDTLKTIGANIR